MAVQLAVLAAFVGIFAVATWRKVNIGVLMFAAAGGVGIWLADMPLEDVIAGFPLGILVLLVGVTYFFGIAQANGTVDRIIESTLGKVGDRTALLPVAFFVLSGGIASMGSPLGALVVAPIGMSVAKRQGIDPMLMALSMGTGLSAGAFAPTSLFGIITYGTAHEAGIDLSPLVLFAVALLANLVLFVCAFVMFGGLRLLRRGGRRSEAATSRVEALVTVGAGGAGGAEAAREHPHRAAGGDHEPAPGGRDPFTRTQIATVVAMLGLVGAVIGLSLAGSEPDIGVLGFAFGAALALIDPASGRRAISAIDWSTVLLVGGIITYVGVLQSLGAVDLLGKVAGSMSIPLVAATLLCLIAGLISAFASTTGMLAALVPLALPLVASGNIAGWAVICALAICASIVDVSPFSTVGATYVATTADKEQHPRMTSLLMRWGLSMVVIGPIVLVGALVVPSMAF